MFFAVLSKERTWNSLCVLVYFQCFEAFLCCKVLYNSFRKNILYIKINVLAIFMYISSLRKSFSNKNSN